MKSTYTVIVAVACLLLASTTLAGTNITWLETHEQMHYLRTDPVVADYELSWLPQVTNPKDKPHIDLSASQNVEPRCVGRATSWLLLSGDPASIDWATVRTMLAARYSLGIGEPTECAVAGMLDAPECCRAAVDLYSAYVRIDFLVDHNGRIARFAVLRPVHGFATVFREVAPLSYNGCVEVTMPTSAIGVCASAADTPTSGALCDADGSGGKKRQFESDFVPAVPNREADVTWGAIKALYGSD